MARPKRDRPRRGADIPDPAVRHGVDRIPPQVYAGTIAPDHLTLSSVGVAPGVIAGQGDLVIRLRASVRDRGDGLLGSGPGRGH
jgi:hypothetical protein